MSSVDKFDRLECLFGAFAILSLLRPAIVFSHIAPNAAATSLRTGLGHAYLPNELDISNDEAIPENRRVLVTDSANKSNSTSSTETEVLLRFREAIIRDPGGVLDSWNSTKNPNLCSWAGITCDTSNHVSTINLSTKQLTGNISPLLGRLNSLSSLILAHNTFTGPIPSSLGTLRRLRHLDLSENNLTSRIPPEISNCSSLTYLNFFSNNLSGPIPRKLDKLRNISFISFTDNHLSASIPRELGNCSSLQYLDLGWNQLTGTIPYELGRLRQLSTLGLSLNLLSGSIPKSLWNCTTLKFLTLGLNNLTGKIAPEVGELRELVVLELENTGLEGSIPASLGNLSSLTTLDLGCIPSLNSFALVTTCPLTGHIPPELGRLRSLTTFFMTGTNVTGRIPDELGNLSNISQLYFSFNQLTGHIPPALGNLTTVFALNLDGNQLEGKIPGSLGGLANVGWLSFMFNQLTGNVPAEFGNLTKIYRLLFSHNRLSGSVPSELGKLATLQELGLDYNEFSGELPAALGNCSKLTQAFLSFNNISGSLPAGFALGMKALYNLSFSHNQLSGSIPEEIGSMKSLEYFNLSFNNLSGPIPSSIEECQDLSTMDISNNYLSGPLPIAALEGLLNLKNFTVANNNLEGAIPERVGAFVNMTAESYAGNAGLCGPILAKNCTSNSVCHGIGGSCHRVWIYIASAGAAILLAVLIITVLLLFCRGAFRKRADTNANLQVVRGLFRNENLQNTALKIPKQANELKLTMEDLWRATGGFSELNVLGKGGESTVYKAVLPRGDGTIFAVKCMRVQQSEIMDTKSHGLYHELQILRKIRHRNLIKYHGYCATQNVTALLMEFAPNGSLESHLHPNQSETQEHYHELHKCQLSLETRIGIAVGVADAMAYLHQECQEPIIHSDLKPSNILLDYEFHAKIVDFGISRYVKKDRQNEEATVSAVYGTTGYIPPEYATSNRVSTKGDVYSYGVILLELMTGKRPTDQSFAQDETWLADWVRKAFPHRIPDILDNLLKQVYQNLTDEEQIRLLIRVGLLCTREVATDRPSMPEIQKMLAHIAEITKPGTVLTDTESLIYQE